jgi:hypothetical protein
MTIRHFMADTMSLIFQWLSMLALFASAVYFCLGMAFGWPISPFLMGFVAAGVFALIGYLFRSRPS